MDLQIKGQKHLNSNRYQSIKIKSIRRNIDKGLIEVRTKEPYLDTLILSPPKFMDTIKDLTEIEKVKEIIEYFTRNNAIYRMIEENGVHVFSTSDRQLDIEMGFSNENQVFLRKTMSRLIYNYLDNRLNVLEKHHSCKSFHIIGDFERSDYEIYEDLDGSNQTIWLHLLCDKDSLELRDFEHKFLENFIIEKIGEQNQLAKYEEYQYTEADTLNIHDYTIFCGGIKFQLYKISERDLNNLTQKINAYNNNFTKQESMQLKLKLEGEDKNE